MTLSIKSKKPTFFITKNFSKDIIEKSDLVLSPEFYWVKKVSLNIKFAYEVKKMAESIFDGLLPPSSYEYKVYKIKEKEFILIAYDIEHIKEELNCMGVNMGYVDKIYTAQSEFLDVNVKVDEEFGLVTCNGIVVYSPMKLLNIKKALHVEELLKEKKLSSNCISHFKNSDSSSKYFNLIASILVLLNLIVFLNIIKLYKDKNQLENYKTAFIEKYNLPITSFQIQGIKDELAFVEKKQTSFREAIFYINKFKLLKNEFFNSVHFKDNSVVWSIELKNQKREKILKKYISKKFNVLKSKKENRSLIVEIQL